jgi:hypothetical protein
MTLVVTVVFALTYLGMALGRAPGFSGPIAGRPSALGDFSARWDSIPFILGQRGESIYQ